MAYCSFNSLDFALENGTRAKVLVQFVPRENGRIHRATSHACFTLNSGVSHTLQII